MAKAELPSIKIRGARASDRDPILSFTQNTFHWGDYIPHAWDEWQHSSSGKLLVATVKGVAVGTLHVAFMGRREAWFEGMRVHPDFRQQGIAGALNSRACEIARSAGCNIVRLETATDNLNAQAALARFGYRHVLNLREWFSTPRAGGAAYTRLALPRDMGDLKRLWDDSWMRRATRSLWPLRNPWHWAIFVKSRFIESIASGRVWITPKQGSPQGFAEVSGEDDSLGVMLIVGRAQAVGHLLSDVRATADLRGQEKCYLVLPSSARADAWARASGFKSEREGMLIYQLRL